MAQGGRQRRMRCYVIDQTRGRPAAGELDQSAASIGDAYVTCAELEAGAAAGPSSRLSTMPSRRGTGGRLRRISAGNTDPNNAPGACLFVFGAAVLRRR